MSKTRKVFFVSFFNKADEATQNKLKIVFEKKFFLEKLDISNKYKKNQNNLLQ